MGRLLAAALVLAAALTAGASATPDKPHLVTLAYTNGPVLAFAQDGATIAWATSRNCTAEVRIRSLKTKVQRLVGTGDPGGHCTLLARTRLVLAGRRAIWTHDESGNLEYTYAHSGTLAVHPASAVADASSSMGMGGYDTGTFFGGLAAAPGALLVYSIVDLEVTGSSSCDETDPPTCTPVIKGGTVSRYDSASHLVPGAPSAVMLAASGTSIALVPAAPTKTQPVAAANGPVQVRNSSTGTLIGTFSPAGTVRAIAFSGPTVAVLVAGPDLRVERYTAATGALLGSTPVPAATAAALSMDNQRIVLRNGKTIAGIDVATGALSTLWTATVVPVVLSISAGRVAWGESPPPAGKLQGRIVALVS